MNTLPSFVELMASLGLDSHASHASQPSPRPGSASVSTHSRSSSLSSTASFPDSDASSNVSSHPQSDIYSAPSPSIVISNIDDSPRPRVPERRRSPGRIARYSPYAPPISHARKGSSASATTDEEACDRPIRRMQSSPFLSSSLSSSDNSARRSTTYAQRMANKRPDKLTLAEGDFTATPISSFVRRKTPSASPTTTEFVIRKKRARSPAPPMSIPTLPFVFPPSPTYASFDSDLEDDDMDGTYQPKPKSYRAAQPRKATPDAPTLYDSNGVRISAFSRPASRLDEHSHLASASAA